MMNLFCTTSLCRSWGTKWEDIPSSFERGPGKRENLGHVASLPPVPRATSDRPFRHLDARRDVEGSDEERSYTSSRAKRRATVSPFLVSSFPRGKHLRLSLLSTRKEETVPPPFSPFAREGNDLWPVWPVCVSFTLEKVVVLGNIRVNREEWLSGL
jgi:hypothetical protein